MIKRTAFALSALVCLQPAFAADTPNPVTPGYQICSNASGATICGFQPVDASHPFPVTTGTAGVSIPAGVSIQSQFPVSTSGVAAVPISGNGTGTTGAVVGTLAAAAGKKTYICGFAVSAAGSAAVGPITIAGLVGSSQVYQATASSTGGVVAQATFTPCIPSSAVNTAITITTTADASATGVDVNSWGFQF